VAKGLRRTVVEGKARWTLGDFNLPYDDTELCEMAYLKGQTDLRNEAASALETLADRINKMEATIRGK